MTNRKAAVFLWFDSEAEDAANFYAATFPDSAIENVIRPPGDVPGTEADAVQLVEMTLCGIPYVLLNADLTPLQTTPIRCRFTPGIRPRPTGCGMRLSAMAARRCSAAGARTVGATVGRSRRAR